MRLGGNSVTLEEKVRNKMFIQNPLVRLTAILTSKSGETHRVANLYIRMFDEDWPVIEEYLTEIYHDATGRISDDEPMPEISTDPVSGLKCVDSHSCFIDFTIWAQFQVGVLNEAVDESTKAFFDVFIENVTRIAGGTPMNKYLVLLNWNILHDGTTIDPKDIC